MNQLLNNLNQQQIKAITTADRNMMIVAGAGSGKTRVLTHKIAYLLQQGLAESEQIMAMTFTNRAASEMKERIAKLLDFRATPRYVGTFHSLAARFLRRYAEHLGYQQDFAIYDESDQKTLFKQCLKEKNIDDSRLAPNALISILGDFKNRSLDYLQILGSQQGYFAEQTFELIDLYQKKLKENQAMDFSDLLLNFLFLLRHVENVKEELQQQFKHIFVDEYQDTNKVQLYILRELVQRESHIYVVGDDDQSIYSWRGACVDNMLQFEKYFADPLILKLEQNYRSTKKILSLANAIIENNSARRGKNLWTAQERGSTPSLKGLENEREEAKSIADTIDKIVYQKQYGYNKFAIFYRINAQSRVLEEEFIRRGMPYRIFGGTKFYQRKEIKDVLAYLKLLVNPADQISLERVINVPPRKIGKKSLEIIKSRARQAGKSTFSYILDAGELPPTIEKKVAKFRQQLKTIISFKEQLSPSRLTSMLLDETGYLESLNNNKLPENQSRMENLHELLASMKEREEENSEEDLKDFLEDVSLMTDIDNYASDQEYISLMTIHSAKGLEFPVVFVSGLEEGLFPHKKSIDSPEQLEEERRLLYVAVTRARRQLFLSYANQRRLQMNHNYNLPSRFIDEMPQELLVIEQQRPSFFTSPRSKSKRIAPAEEFHYDPFPDYELANTASHPFIPGVKVLHPQFGTGIIKRAEGNEENLKLTVNFKRDGVKKLLARYCSLEIVD